MDLQHENGPVDGQPGLATVLPQDGVLVLRIHSGYFYCWVNEVEGTLLGGRR